MGNINRHPLHGVSIMQFNSTHERGVSALAHLPTYIVNILQ